VQSTKIPIRIVPYEPSWPALFRQTAAPMREALGHVALRIDHIGSTAVPGLAAKPVIDIQISVPSFDPLNAFRDPLEKLGYVFRSENPDRMKRYFREAPGARRTHIHIQLHGSWSEQLALLFRDYLRTHQDVAARYAALKSDLARRFGYDREGYTNAKGPFIWATIADAHLWAQTEGWSPRPSDA
jgi:GrpB-like predicted nucleotidyltransferase (UPF0157 family)